MSAADQSPEQRELALVGKVELKIALASSDTKLESTLNTYLAPLLLKLASEHASVRNKVISICQHISTRVKPATVQIPVSALIKQFKDQQNPLIRHFDILYIQQGVERLSSSQKAELLPVILGGLASAERHAPQVFNLFLKLLEHFTLPVRGSKDDLEIRANYEVSDADAAYLAQSLGKLLLFVPRKDSRAIPALSKEDVDFLNVQGKPDVWNASAGGLNILRTKLLATRILTSGLFNDRERFLPALFATADSASTVNDNGEDMMKRVLASVNLEEDAVQAPLFNLYFGQDDIPRASISLRIKILQLLLKSTKSTTYPDYIVKIAKDGVVLAETDGEDIVMSNSGSATSTPNRQLLKLRSAVFEYINFVARYGPSDVLHQVAPTLVYQLKDFIEDQGWPKPGLNDDLTTRAFAYEVLGLLIKSGPKNLVFEDNHPSLALMRWMFTSLASDLSSGTTIVSIEEAMSTILAAISRMELTSDEQTALEDLLVNEMLSSTDLKASRRIRSTRFSTVRLANRCLPYSSVKARWVDILAIGAADEKMEVKEEGERGLSPYWYHMLSGGTGQENKESVQFPSFRAVIQQLFPGETLNDSSVLKVVQDIGSKHRSTIRHMIDFSRRIFYNEALQQGGYAPALVAEWERAIESAIENDTKTRTIVKSFMRDPSAPLKEMRRLQAAMLERLLSQEPLTGQPFVQYLSLAPDHLLSDLVPHAESILPVISSNNHDTRSSAAHAFAILASHPSSTSTNQYLQELFNKTKTWQTAVGSQVSQVHGATVTLGYYFARRQYRGLLLHDEALCKDFIIELTQELMPKAKDAMIKESAFTAVGQLAMFGALKLDSTVLKACADKLYESAKTSDETAIIALGQLAMACDSTDDLAYFEEKLHDLHEVRQAEVHFSVGEAFTYLASGWQSSALATKLDIDGDVPQGHDTTGVVERLVQRFIKDCANTKPALKKAAVMWLLCLVQYCGHLPALQSRLAQCQQAFKHCLVDRDELIQESASRGLGLVYEKGDRSLRDDLVKDLVSSFSSDKQSSLAGTVSADTQLFEPGALPTGDGSVSTYKDIMSLASEVGDSSLVYKFMSMASSNAIWSSRAAFGRFGLSNVLSDSSVDGYLADNPKLYPKLYRYRFDPNTGVRRSMNDIWNALVKDSAVTINTHFDAIIQDLLVSILGKEWRTRQASCAAIADLLQGRPLEKYESYLEDVWNKCFKVLDDIKESVRAAAASLARTLTGILTRALESDDSSSKTAGAMLKHVLPFLLSPSGMESSAQEVQMFAVHTLLEIIKKSSGITLRPFIPELVERLIGLLSSLEPEAVNYIHLNASKYNLTEQKIDDMRLSSVRSSPIMEAIERCLDLLDDETMTAMQPRLDAAMKGAVGLPSKVGASRILVSLATRRTQIFKTSADHFLKLIEKLVLDRNETVSSSYAAAAGYVARHASDKQVLRFVTFIKSLYFKSEGDREGSVPRRSISSAELTYALMKHANDRFNAVAASILPLVFFAKHDPHEAVKEQSQNTWSEAVGGNRAVQLYLTEILELVKESLVSPQWTLKHTAARTIADAINSICASEKQLSRATSTALWPVLDNALSGKTWDGKEVLLPAFVKFVEGSSSLWQEDSSVAAAIVTISIREAKRNNVEYRQHSIKSLARIAALRTDIDVSEEVHQIVVPIIQETQDQDVMDIDVETNKSQKPAEELRDNTLAAAIQALMLSVIPRQGKMSASFEPSLSVLSSIKQPLAPSVFKASCEGLKKFFDSIERSAIQDEPNLASMSEAIRNLLFGLDAGSEASRQLRAETVLQIFKSSMPLATSLRESVVESKEHERSIRVRDLLAACLAQHTSGHGS